MQKSFLFDNEDPKQCGKGCDALAAANPRLRFKWQWYSGKKKNIPHQVSVALLQNGWWLKVTFWHTEYEARVERYDRGVAFFKEGYHDELGENKILLTRLDAQIKAEKLFKQLGKDILRQCRGK